jgi:hypothetical protein
VIEVPILPELVQMTRGGALPLDRDDVWRPPVNGGAQIFGENAARIFEINIAAARQEADLLYKLRDDRDPLPAGAAPL